MIKINFQIQHKNRITLENLAGLLHSQIGDEANLEIEDITDWFSLENMYLLPNDTVVSLYVLEFEPLELRDMTNETIIENLLKDIQGLKNYEGNEIVESVTKFQDNTVLDKGLQYHKEIYEIEMELRAILTYIIAFDERTSISDMFKDFGMGTMPDFNKNNAEKHFENALFYSSFKLYGELNVPKPLNAKETAERLQQSTSFDDFRFYLDSRNIKTERHVNFLSSIKANIDTIEKLRNAIMHNRAISNKAENNYLKSRDELSPILSQFWEDEKAELDAFAIWKKYAKEEAERVLALVEWDIENNIIKVPDIDGLSDEYDEVRGFILELETYVEGFTEMFANEEEQEEERGIHSNFIVIEALREYKEQVENMGVVFEMIDIY